MPLGEHKHQSGLESASPTPTQDRARHLPGDHWPSASSPRNPKSCPSTPSLQYPVRKVLSLSISQWSGGGSRPTQYPLWSRTAEGRKQKPPGGRKIAEIGDVSSLQQMFGIQIASCTDETQTCIKGILCHDHRAEGWWMLTTYLYPSFV